MSDGKLQVIQHPDAGAFLGRAEGWLLEREADNNILLSVAYLLEQRAQPFVEPAYLATVEDHGKLVGCVMRPPPDGVYMTALPRPALPFVAAQLRTMFDDVPEVLGPEPAASAFAVLWRPDAWTLNNRFRRYVLDRVLPPQRPAPGQLRPARSEDLTLLDAWAAHYRAETGAQPDIAALFRTMLARNALHLWDDRGPRCVVTASGRTRHGARISATYTPPAFRGNGYAKSAVAALCQSLLDEGRRFCVIVADVADPAPNAVYRSIGFRSAGELVLIHFPGDRIGG